MLTKRLNADDQQESNSEDEIIDEEEELEKQAKRFSGKFAGIEDILARKQMKENGKQEMKVN